MHDVLRRRAAVCHGHGESQYWVAVAPIQLARRLAIIAVLVVALAPVVWLFSIAYKPTSDIFASPPQLLFSPTWDNFQSVFRYFNLWALLKSSLVIAIGSTILSLIIGVPAGYALARAESSRHRSASCSRGTISVAAGSPAFS